MSLVGIHRDSKNMNCFLRKLFWNGRRALLESITTEIEHLYSVTRVAELSPPLWEFEILKNMAQYLRFPLQADPTADFELEPSSSVADVNFYFRSGSREPGGMNEGIPACEEKGFVIIFIDILLQFCGTGVWREPDDHQAECVNDCAQGTNA